LTRSYLSSFFKFISSSSANDPIKQIESDDQRNIVFTRSESGLLQAFDLGQDGSGFSRFGYLTFEGIVNEVVNISKKTLESNVVKKILTISPVTNGKEFIHFCSLMQPT
jgi:nuclear pore complex protein Nup155